MKLTNSIVLQFVITACCLLTISSAEELPSIDENLCPQLKNPFVAAKYVNQHKEAIDNIGTQQLKKLPPLSVFKFLSGNTDPVNNLPMMFAHDSKNEKKVTVIGCGVHREFPLWQLEDAVKVYKELLVLNGY